MPVKEIVRFVSWPGFERIFNTDLKTWRRILWSFIVAGAVGFLIFHLWDRFNYYREHPVNTDIRIEYKDRLEQPMVVVCMPKLRVSCEDCDFRLQFVFCRYDGLGGTHCSDPVRQFNVSKDDIIDDELFCYMVEIGTEQRTDNIYLHVANSVTESGPYQRVEFSFHATYQNDAKARIHFSNNAKLGMYIWLFTPSDSEHKMLRLSESIRAQIGEDTEIKLRLNKRLLHHDCGEAELKYSDFYTKDRCFAECVEGFYEEMVQETCHCKALRYKSYIPTIDSTAQLKQNVSDQIPSTAESSFNTTIPEPNNNSSEPEYVEVDREILIAIASHLGVELNLPSTSKPKTTTTTKPSPTTTKSKEMGNCVTESETMCERVVAKNTKLAFRSFARKHCLQKCPTECYNEYFEQKQVAHSYFQLKPEKSSMDNRTDIQLARVSIFYETLGITTIDIKPSYSWLSLLSDIGGALALSPGLRLIVLVQLADYLICKFCSWLKKNKVVHPHRRKFHISPMVELEESRINDILMRVNIVEENVEEILMRLDQIQFELAQEGDDVVTATNSSSAGSSRQSSERRKPNTAGSADRKIIIEDNV